MKVLLLDNVKDTGKKGAIVTVADGLARNKLIPLKKAVEATPSNIAKYQHLAAQSPIANGIHESQNRIMEICAQTPITLSGKSDSHGSLYQSVHESDILKELHRILPKELLSQLTTKNITIPTPIKKLGDHTIVLFGSRTIPITVTNK
jgi:ribosomal protein L9